MKDDFSKPKSLKGKALGAKTAKSEGILAGSSCSATGG
jgi:hypothetical protein